MHFLNIKIIFPPKKTGVILHPYPIIMATSSEMVTFICPQVGRFKEFWLYNNIIVCQPQIRIIILFLVCLPSLAQLL